MARFNVRVRPADPADAPDLAALAGTINTAGRLHGGKTAELSTEQLAARFARVIDQDGRIVLVACDEDDDVIGMLAARSDELSTVDVTSVLHVTHLAVRPTHRRRGVGRALLSTLVNLAEERGSDQIVASAAAGSREGNRYLARLGFAPLVVRRSASIATLRRSLGMTDVATRVATLRRARLVRAQRAGFSTRTASRGA